MSRVVIGLAGRRGSGKSTIAASLHLRFGFARVSFGNYVRSVAQERARPDDLASLETLGRTLIVELGWDQFCTAVLAGTGSAARVVVDGFRHIDARTTIRNLVAPGRFGLVFVEIDETLRLQRLSARARPGDAIHGGEMSDELELLRRDADLIVDGAQSDAASKIVSWTESLIMHY